MGKIVWDFHEEPVDYSKILSVANDLGVTFSTDYVECVLENHGASPFPNVFDIEIAEGFVFGALLNFIDGASESVISALGMVSDALPSYVIPFAKDPGGNLLCFDYVNGPDKD